jgi:hypothetical protein
MRTSRRPWRELFVALISILGILALADVLFDDKKTNTTALCSPQNVRFFRGGGVECIIPVKFMSGLPGNRSRPGINRVLSFRWQQADAFSRKRMPLRSLASIKKILRLARH